MYQKTISIKNLKHLKDFLSSDIVEEQKNTSKVILAMVFTAHVNEKHLHDIGDIIIDFSLEVVLIGATTTGEIDNGNTITESTTVTLTFFEETHVFPIAVKCDKNEEVSMGIKLREEVDKHNPLAVMLLTTPLSYDVNIFIQSFTQKSFEFEIFGGGAGDYAMDNSLLLCANDVINSGVIAICFSGESFQIQKHTFVGWHPMSKKMTITKAKGTTVYTIDDKPAFDVYKNYFNIDDDINFFANAIGFPMISESKGDYLARVPVNVGEDGSLEFITDFKELETFRLGFAYPELIDENLKTITHKLNSFSPEAIFLFSCGCRRYALHDDIQNETQAFADIAPVAGFYTIGEFCNIGGEVSHMNLAFVAVGIKEIFTFSSDVRFAPEQKQINTLLHI